jgi:hypothetical protein
VNQGPRGDCLMKKNRGSNISWHCSFKNRYRYLYPNPYQNLIIFSDLYPAKPFGYFRIRIRNTAYKHFHGWDSSPNSSRCRVFGLESGPAPYLSIDPLSIRTGSVPEHWPTSYPNRFRTWALTHFLSEPVPYLSIDPLPIRTGSVPEHWPTSYPNRFPGSVPEHCPTSYPNRYRTWALTHFLSEPVPYLSIDPLPIRTGSVPYLSIDPLPIRTGSVPEHWPTS